MEGIKPVVFSALLLQSGLLNNEKITWIVFHGNQDLGYFQKLINFEDIETIDKFKYSLS